METAISACPVIPARELASLAHACGTLKNVSKPQMLVRPHISCSCSILAQVQAQGKVPASSYRPCHISSQKPLCSPQQPTCLFCFHMSYA